MPQMPDPISTCPIFDQLWQFTQTADHRDELFDALKDHESWVDAGIDLRIISKRPCWECPAGTKAISEVYFLKTLWLDEKNGWWPCDQYPQRDGWNEKLDVEIRRAAWLAKNKGLPIQGWWECPLERFDASAELAKPLKNRIWLRVETAAGVECTSC
ncbi:MAG: hypothetical protein ABFS46_12055 [Myxococcota bacterium]